ncbi:MAG: ligand-binding protein, RmlD family [Candidatus Pelagibacter sp. TMED197]|nr:MAG: ligand-binding protein, RmlD family [Candidatus Pelagibacter sp. TMED197]|tara:strand:+ start:1653 stop:2363 length:711 start_codon:yes stop_codon:yes gene_type:complete
MKKKIVVTGGSGRFGNCLKSVKTKHSIFFPQKKIFNILKLNTLKKYLEKTKADTVIHLAGLSRPMSIHEKDIKKSIELNIIGTANVTKVCSELGVKLIYFSTNYVYPGIKGNYSESDHLHPVNNYAWSKLGGECSVQLYKNSLIVRVCMTEKPFLHKEAFANVKSSFMYHEEVAKILFKILDKKGIINVGGKPEYIYDFARKDNKSVRKAFLKKNANIGMPFNSSLNTRKLKKIIK